MRLGRERLFAFVFLLLTLNGLAGFLALAEARAGWAWAALDLFDVSAIVWLALAAGLALLWNAADQPPARPVDWVGTCLAVIVAFIPTPVASAAMLSVVGLSAVVSGGPTSVLRRSGLIFLSLTAFLIWGRIALALGAGLLLRADAGFVSLVSGLPSSGNAVGFAGGGRFLVAPGCSSLHEVSLALILWTTVVQYFAIASGRRAWLTLALAVVAAIAVNCARLATIAWHPRDFDYWHVGMGAAQFGWVALAAIVAVTYRGLADAPRRA